MIVTHATILSARAQLIALPVAPFVVRAHCVPASLSELRQAIASGEPLPVYSGHSDGTVWGDHALNHRFRAWHDSRHSALQVDFDYAGENRAAKDATQYFQGDDVRALVWAEVWGQVLHHERYGAFPTNQLGFTLCAARRGVDIATATNWS